MRLANDALVLSVSRASGRLVAGLLSSTFHKATKANQIFVPIVEWMPDGSSPEDEHGGGRGQQRAAALELLLEWSPGFDEDELLGEMRKLGAQGTMVLLYNLKENGNKLELDIESDEHDIRLRESELAEEEASRKKKAGGRGGAANDAHSIAIKEKYFGYRTSLRQYASILYLEFPKGFQIYIRGEKVTPRSIVKDLKYKCEETYTPRLVADTHVLVSVPASLQAAHGPTTLSVPTFFWSTVGDVRSEAASALGVTPGELALSFGDVALPVDVTALASLGIQSGARLEATNTTRPSTSATSRATTAAPTMTCKIKMGFAREAPNAAVQGFNVYHCNRLIKPLWDVYKTPSSVGRGVIGVLEVNFLRPSHNKQDIDRTTDTYRNLESKLKMLQPAYWKREGRRVGYQSADALPPTRREREEMEAEAAEAARWDDDDDDDEQYLVRGDFDDDAQFAATSRLGGTSQGGRLRRLPQRMLSYRIEHRAVGERIGTSQGAGEGGGGGGDASSPSSSSSPGAGGAGPSSAHLSRRPPLCPDDSCPICFERVTIDNVSGGRTPCGHVFHMGCILQCVRDGAPGELLCPVCRHQLYRTRGRVFAPLAEGAVTVLPAAAVTARSGAGDADAGADASGSFVHSVEVVVEADEEAEEAEALLADMEDAEVLSVTGFAAAAALLGEEEQEVEVLVDAETEQGWAAAGGCGETSGGTQNELERLQAEQVEQERIVDAQRVIIQEHEEALDAARRAQLDAERRRKEILERVDALRAIGQS
jgi:hypothetical protein